MKRYTPLESPPTVCPICSCRLIKVPDPFWILLRCSNILHYMIGISSLDCCAYYEQNAVGNYVIVYSSGKRFCIIPKSRINMINPFEKIDSCFSKGGYPPDFKSDEEIENYLLLT